MSVEGGEVSLLLGGSELVGISTSDLSFEPVNYLSSEEFYNANWEKVKITKKQDIKKKIKCHIKYGSFSLGLNSNEFIKFEFRKYVFNWNGFKMDVSCEMDLSQFIGKRPPRGMRKFT